MDIQLKYMKIALNEAKKAAEKDEVPVGCVIVKNEKIIAKTHNLCRKKHNPLAHCEILAIEKACKKLNTEKLFECKMYITLEPCIMCAMAVSLAGIEEIIYATDNIKEGGTRIYKEKMCCFKPKVKSGILKNEASQILSDFFKKKRK